MKIDSPLHPLHPIGVKGSAYYHQMIGTRLIAEGAYTSKQGNDNTLNNLESVTDKLKGQILDIKV